MEEKSKGMAHVFRIVFCTGDWAAETGGCPWVAVRGDTKAKDGLEWCTAYNMPSSAQFDSGLYGEHEATAYAQAWCSRQNYLYSLWLEQEDAKYIYTKADLSGWKEPDACSAARSKATTKQLRYIGDRFTKIPKMSKLHVCLASHVF